MTGQRFVVIGAGGHAKVVADALLAAGHELVGFTDADPARRGSRLLGAPVLGDDDSLPDTPPTDLWLALGLGGAGRAADVAAGALAVRRAVCGRLQRRGWRFLGVRHPHAIVSPFAEVHEQAQLLAACVVQAGARVGEGCIVNSAAVIEHDCVLQAWCHVAPRAVLCGNVTLGSRSHVGAGAVIRQGVALGERTVVGAGAVVVRDFAGGGVLAGVPATPRPAGDRT